MDRLRPAGGAADYNTGTGPCELVRRTEGLTRAVA